MKNVLRQFLNEHFDDSELRTLCFDLGVDYDELRGESKTDKVRELVAYFARRGQSDYLAGTVMMLRPQVWGRKSKQRGGFAEPLSARALDGDGREYRELVLLVIGRVEARVDRMMLVLAGLLALSVTNTIFLLVLMTGR